MLIERSLSGDNIKSFIRCHPSSSSFSSYSRLNSSKLEKCSGLSILLSNKIKEDNKTIVANASESISNAHSFIINRRRHSWNGEFLSYIRRTKSFRYQNKIIQVKKSLIFPLSTNINNKSLSNASTPINPIKTTATNAFLTAASLFKYWVDF